MADTRIQLEVEDWVRGTEFDAGGPPIQLPIFRILDNCRKPHLGVGRYPSTWHEGDFTGVMSQRPVSSEALGADDRLRFASLLWRALWVGVRFCDRACRNEQGERNPLTLRHSQCAA